MKYAGNDAETAIKAAKEKDYFLGVMLCTNGKHDFYIAEFSGEIPGYMKSCYPNDADDVELFRDFLEFRKRIME